VTTNVPL